MSDSSFDVFARKIELFDRYVRNGTARQLSEAQTRIEFIDSMIRALGWDVNNERACNQFDRELIVEEAIDTDDRDTKTHPDYTFKEGSNRLLFWEAKRPSVNIREDPASALQIRRYVWSAQLPAGVLTDFEELSIYDGRVPPSSDDRPTTARSLYVKYDRYLDEWDTICDALSREAVLSGEFAKSARSGNVSEKNREPFDKMFLFDLEKWRLTLAQSINKLNRISLYELNYSTQIILDRIIFLRVAEARDVQPRETLSLLECMDSNEPYVSLQRVFKQADERYNSGLFHFRKEKGRTEDHDSLTPRLTINSGVLRKIIRELYPPHSPYAFSTVSSDILGSVYERFLGKELRVEQGNVTDELKPSVRKQGGVYYTPGWIARYMVQSTVTKHIRRQKVDQVRTVRVCDPACGSGAFLVAAYQAIINEHIRRYLRRRDLTNSHLVMQSNGTYTLSIVEKKRILKDCIHGIDIDSAAVEITKLSLLLVALEGETSQTVDRQLTLFLERALPDLSNNIICGNSLLSATDLGVADHEAIDKLKPVDWDATFPNGFDVVLGNPPYVFGEWHDPIQLRVLKERLSGIRQIDLYHAFIERMVERQGDAYWALIVPDAVLARDDTTSLRKVMLERGGVLASHVGEVFEDAGVSCVVLVQGPSYRDDLVAETIQPGTEKVLKSQAIPRNIIKTFPDVGFRLGLTEQEAKILSKLVNCGDTVGEHIAKISRGEELGKRSILQENNGSAQPCVVGENIEEFTLTNPTRFVEKSSVKKGAGIYSAPKAVTVKTGTYPKTAIDRIGYVTLQSVYNLTPKKDVAVEVIAAVLNSSISKWYIKIMYTSRKKLFPQMNQRHIVEVPFPKIDDQSAVVEAVQHLENAKTKREREFLDQKIDGMICAAFDLTALEVRIIKAGMN